MRCLPVAVMLAIATWSCAALAHEPAAQARYLGNEGVLFSVCGARVLFDAFYSDSHGQYVLVPETMRDDMRAGRPPYDGVVALFISHVHGDHFTPQPTLAYLRVHRDVRAYAPQQVVTALRDAAGPEDAPVLARVVAFDLVPGQTPLSVETGDLQIDVVAIPHAGGERMADIANLVFRVTVKGTATVMHLGDAVIDENAFERQRTHWDAMRSDVAFPPFWFMDSETGRRINETRLNASQVIGIHVPAVAVGQGDTWRQQLQGDLFTDPGETRVIAEVVCDDQG